MMGGDVDERKVWALIVVLALATVVLMIVKAWGA